MAIKIIRHFKVQKPKETMMDSAGFESWVEGYDAAALARPLCPDDGRYDVIYTGTLSRSIQTAEYFAGFVRFSTPMLNEVPISPFCRTSVRLPLWLWLFAGRVGWVFGHRSQPEGLKSSLQRAKDISKTILSAEGDVLVVSHGLFLILLRLYLLSQKDFPTLSICSFSSAFSIVAYLHRSML